MQIHEGTEAIREQAHDLVASQLRHLTEVVSRLNASMVELQQQVRDLRSQAIRFSAALGEDG